MTTNTAPAPSETRTEQVARYRAEHAAKVAEHDARVRAGHGVIGTA